MAWERAGKVPEGPSPFLSPRGVGRNAQWPFLEAHIKVPPALALGLGARQRFQGLRGI